MEISKHFSHGEGDYLYYLEKDKFKKALDLTGGYGANLLGHRNPSILSKIKQWCHSGSPSLTQGSLRLESGKLAKLLSDILARETSEGPWITTFSNTGTEAVEAAMKHCLIYHNHKFQSLQQEISKELNLATMLFVRTQEKFQDKLLTNLRKDLMELIPSLKMNDLRKDFFFHQISNVHTIHELVSLIRDMNQKQISQKPIFCSLEKAYHGKTMGALSITSSETFREPFYLGAEYNTQTKFLNPYLNASDIDQIIQSTQEDLVSLSCIGNKIEINTHRFSLIAGAFIEPIQGEAGVRIVPDSFIALIKKHSLQEDFLLVFDEIQSGMFRTGLLAAGNHSHITADMYTFSKSLGGGVAKIAATTIIGRKYIEEFGFLHSSTFSDDDFSSSIALEVLTTLNDSPSLIEEGMQNANYLQVRLEWLKSMYPEIIKEIRGRGFMLAIEFHDLFKEMGFEFKTICDAGMQGYMMASVLLNHENLRMNPSLSNNLTLRIQPSLYFDIIQAEELISGLTRLCEAFKHKNIQYFLSSVYPNQDVMNERTPDLNVNLEPSNRPLSVFLCHLIDEGHIKKVSQSLKNVPGKILLNKLALAKDLAEFEIYHTQTLKDNSGKEMDIILMGVSVTSEELKKTFISKNKYKVVQKVQNAIDYAKSLGATTVGLGQFTSIVSGNGLYLDSKGMNITTGNAFTISLTVQSALRSAKEKNIELNSSVVALVGAAGNIMSVASSLMADHVGKMILIHHSPIEASFKFQEAVKRILNDINSSNIENNLTRTIKQFWSSHSDLIDFLNIPEVSKVFMATSDLTSISQADIVISGASASTGFLTLDLFKKNAVIVDVAVPPTIKKEMLASLESDRPDITYHLGGVANIPHNQSIDMFLLPLGTNECYACMAETFTVGFSGQKNFLNIGDLNKSIVKDVEAMADNVGFYLGRSKDKSSL